VLRGAEIATRASESVGRVGGWVARLVFRLAVLALLLGVGFVVLVYYVARSF
jgi:hypothetical protein